MSNFENNDRRRHEIAMRPVIDAIYNLTWPGCSISREHDPVFDKEYGIDVRITMPNGMLLTGQEKVLRNEYADRRTVTVEYMQNPLTGDTGDWFNLAAQFYFCGYASEDLKMIYPWVILDWAAIVEFTRRGKINWGRQRNSKSNARADFMYVTMEDLPRRAILRSWGLVRNVNYARSDWFTPRQMSLMPEVRQMTLGEYQTPKKEPSP